MRKTRGKRVYDNGELVAIVNTTYAPFVDMKIVKGRGSVALAIRINLIGKIADFILGGTISKWRQEYLNGLPHELKKAAEEAWKE